MNKFKDYGIGTFYEGEAQIVLKCEKCGQEESETQYFSNYHKQGNKIDPFEAFEYEFGTADQQKGKMYWQCDCGESMYVKEVVSVQLVPSLVAGLKELQTKFGLVYRELPYMREESDRIKFYDSNGKYLTYFSKDLYDLTTEEIIDKQILESETPLCLFTVSLLLDTELFSTDWREFSEYGDTQEEVENNDLINKIGDYYIAIKE